MTQGRPAGSKNRNYPALTLAEALLVPRAIQDKASGTAVSRLTLAELLGVSPASSRLRELVAASRLYGLTNGGINADEFSLTPVGVNATGGDEVAVNDALKEAVLNIPPYSSFLKAFNTKKLPTNTVVKEYLLKNADVDPTRVDECVANLVNDAETAGFLRDTKGGKYIDFTATAPPPLSEAENQAFEETTFDAAEDDDTSTPLSTDNNPIGTTAQKPQRPARSDGPPKKVFIAHGKNRVPLDQLKQALDAFKVSYAVAVDEPNKGRPISKKVASLMRDECSSGIFIFTADEKFLRDVDGNTEEVWRPSENVVFELGAASILYENRIVIFKESDVQFPSDYSDLGYIEFEKDQLVAELGNLFKELVGLDILEVRAKG